MSRVALDRNILIYAELEPDSAKGAERLTSYYEAPGTRVIPLQVLGEYPSEKTNLSALMTSGD